jgi:hypothetical protein
MRLFFDYSPDQAKHSQQLEKLGEIEAIELMVEGPVLEYGCHQTGHFVELHAGAFLEIPKASFDVVR